MRREGTWGSLGCRLVLVEYVSSSKYRCRKIFLNDEIITSPAAVIPFYASTLCHCNACPVHMLQSTRTLHDALPTPYSNMPLHIYNGSSPSISPSSPPHPTPPLLFPHLRHRRPSIRFRLRPTPHDPLAQPIPIIPPPSSKPPINPKPKTKIKVAPLT